MRAGIYTLILFSSPLPSPAGEGAFFRCNPLFYVEKLCRYLCLLVLSLQIRKELAIRIEHVPGDHVVGQILK